MKSNSAISSAGPSPTSTHSTTHTVPRSSPLLSSSFTPFYPQSQQENHRSLLDTVEGQDAHCYVSSQDLNGSGVRESHSYEWLGRKFYNAQCYPSSGSEPYQIPWVSNSENVWSGGACWQWDESVSEYLYAGDYAESSTHPHANSSSYFAGSPIMEQRFYACSSSNTAPVPTVGPDQGATTFNTPCNSALLDRSPDIKRHPTPRLKDSFIQGQSVPFCSSGRKAPVKCTSHELSNAPFSTSKPDSRPSSIQVSSQIGSSFGITRQPIEPESKQATACMPEKTGSQKDSSKSIINCNATVEHGSRCAPVSNPSNTVELLAEINGDPPTTAISAEVTTQKEVDIRNNSSLQSSSSQSIPTSGRCAGVTRPKHTSAQAHYSSLVETGAPVDQRNIGSLLAFASPVLETESKPCIEAINHEPSTMHKDTIDSISCLYLNGSQLLVKCIYNLSKVLVSSQSGTSLKILDSNDCFAIEKTICMLSHRLSQFHINEANSCQDQNCHQVAEKELKSATDMLHLPNEKASVKASQQVNSYFLEGGMKHEVKTFYPSRVLEEEDLDGLSRETTGASDEGNERAANQNSWMRGEEELRKLWQDLSMLQCNIMKLQEEVAYERVESNVTVATYKKLWSEAEEALKVSKSEIQALGAELANLKQYFSNLKHSGAGGSRSCDTGLELPKNDRNTLCMTQEALHETVPGSNQRSTDQDMRMAPGKDRCSLVCGSFIPACSNESADCIDPEEIWMNSVENRTDQVKGENVIWNHSEMLTIPSCELPSVHVAEPSTCLEEEVTRRLSLLRSRQSLDLNKRCFDENVELQSELSAISEASTELQKDCDAVPPYRKENYSVFADVLYAVNADQEMASMQAESCRQSQPVFTVAHALHSIMERDSNTRHLDQEGTDVNFCQEDEIEIICFRPAFGESSCAGLKEEPGWEHVVVNSADDQKASR